MSTEKKANVGKTFGIVALLTILSKIAGLARDIIVAQAYGTGIVADAYNYAYLVTGNVLVLFGGLGGPFHSATVAILGNRKQEETAGKLMAQVLLFTFCSLSVISIIAYFAAPYLIDWQAQTYKIDTTRLPDLLKGHDLNFLRNFYKQQLQEQFNIMLPLIVISGLVGVSYGILNVYNKVLWPSLSPAIASLAIIIAVLGWTNPETALLTGLPLAVGTLAGAIGQLLAQVPGTLKTGLKYAVSFQPQPGIKEYRSMLWPAIFSTSIGQLTVYVDAFFTNSAAGQGGWTAIINANRLIQLPLGVLLTAMLVPMLPRFTEQVSARRFDDLKEELRRALRFLWFLALPLTAILAAIPAPIIRLLFQRGNFNAESTELVTAALVFLIPSIFFYVARDLITRVFYAYQDSNTPYRVAVIAIIVKAGLDYLLVCQLHMGVSGISLATTLITIMNLTLLMFFLKQKLGLLGFNQLLRPVSIMLVAATASGIACFGAYSALTYYLQSLPLAQFLRLLFSVGGASAAGLLIYLIVCLAAKLNEPLSVAQRLPFLRNLVAKEGD
ncbi:MAG: murein biosynthesis integral membrane protein MurJ [Candidatus Obscuribacterales bacterium]|nr:murein biosynthesis integral membrane protein MurJ [Candidatus Obscuribacterales bacterium]